MSSRYSPAASGLPAVIGGLLGLEFLSKFEVEFDFVNKAMKFHSPGCIKCGALARACMCVHATRHSLDFGLRRGKYVFNTCFSLVFERLKADGVKARFTVRYGDANRVIDEPCASDVSQLVEIPMSVHPTGLKTVRCRLNGCEPFPAIVDMGSFFSVVNWMAAAAGGVAPDSPEVTQSAMQAVGIDGRAMPMATAKFDLAVVGVMGSGSGNDGGGAVQVVELV